MRQKSFRTQFKLFSLKQVKCEDEKCVGSINLMKSDPRCSLYLDHDSAFHHMVAVQPLSAGKLCPTSIKYEPCKFGKIFFVVYLKRIKCLTF